MKRFIILGVLAAIGCASQPPAKKAEKTRIRLGADWFSLRAGHLGLSIDDARARDAELGPEAPPGDVFWDESVATETAALWNGLCYECHGGKRAPSAAAKIAGPAVEWGAGNTDLFGRDLTWANAYVAIRDGAKPKDKGEEMPGWGKKLAREQIWSLLFYLEHMSKDAKTRLHLERQ